MKHCGRITQVEIQRVSEKAGEIVITHMDRPHDPARVIFLHRARQFCLKVHRTSVTYDVMRGRRANARPGGRGKGS